MKINAEFALFTWSCSYTVSNVNVYADKRKSLAESKYPDERIFWCCFLSRGFHDLFVAKRETDPEKNVSREFKLPNYTWFF